MSRLHITIQKIEASISSSGAKNKEQMQFLSFILKTKETKVKEFPFKKRWPLLIEAKLAIGI